MGDSERLTVTPSEVAAHGSRMQVPADTLEAAKRALESAISSLSGCWGDDEFAQQARPRYDADAGMLLDSLGTAAQTLRGLAKRTRAAACAYSDAEADAVNRAR